MSAKKTSAGLLVYRLTNEQAEVLLVHPGGPFWAKKDWGAWSIPKGQFAADEEPLGAAKREFKEEVGQAAPQGQMIELGTVKLKSGKTVWAWAVEGDLDASNIKSNSFEMEWPPRSGQTQKFPEVDRAAWFDLPTALQKLHPGMEDFIWRLAKQKGLDLKPGPGPDKNLTDTQTSLL